MFKKNSLSDKLIALNDNGINVHNTQNSNYESYSNHQSFDYKGPLGPLDNTI